MVGSLGRIDRTGPMGSASWDWYTTMNRLSPASTTSSYTTSAWTSPDCGRASSTFSIFTTSAGRVRFGELPAGSPVSGKTGGAVVVVVAGAVDVEVLPPPPPEHAAAVRARHASTGASAGRRRPEITV